MKTIFYGITNDFICDEILLNANGSFIKDISKYQYFIKKNFLRKNDSGLMEYNSYKILDKNLNETILSYGDIKLLSISDEYFWDLGKYKANTSTIYYPHFEVPENIETDFSLTFEYINFEIKRKVDTDVICYLEVQDAFGFIKKVPTRLYLHECIQALLSDLIFFNYLKRYITFKLSMITIQMKDIVLINQNEQQKYTNYFTNKVVPLYNESVETNYQIHKNNPIIDTTYNFVKGKAKLI